MFLCDVRVAGPELLTLDAEKYLWDPACESPVLLGRELPMERTWFP